ncbi:helix-turn-helix domain-containing protein [Saccharothrix lopnurensis]|uniref:Helix-turn-helix domain-containing protein n=1 Tax=Saccharothrix lopnurensis TaxID=1670621 RepID=A0ABW1PDQ9_9PSEU
MDTDDENLPVSTRLSTAHRRELGEELRRIRHTARLSSAVVAKSLGWSLGKLSKLETCSRGTGPWEIRYGHLRPCPVDKI